MGLLEDYQKAKKSPQSSGLLEEYMAKKTGGVENLQQPAASTFVNTQPRGQGSELTTMLANRPTIGSRSSTIGETLTDVLRYPKEFGYGLVGGALTGGTIAPPPGRVGGSGVEQPIERGHVLGGFVPSTPYSVGQLLGEFLPISRISRGITATKPLQKIASPVVRRLLTATATGGTYEAGREALQGEINPMAIAGTAAAFPAFELGGMALGKVLGKLKESGKRGVVQAQGQVKPRVLTPDELPFKEAADAVGAEYSGPMEFPSGKKVYGVTLVDKVGEESTIYARTPEEVAPKIAEKRAQYLAANEAKLASKQPVSKTGTTVPEISTPVLPDKTSVPESKTDRLKYANPFYWFYSGGQKLFGAKGVEGGRKLVNPLGTPEVVLGGRNIVEPFRQAKSNLGAHRQELSSKLNEIFPGMKRHSPEDIALFKQLDNPDAVLTGKSALLREYFDNLLIEINKHRVARGQDVIERRPGYITHLVDYANELNKGIFPDMNIPKQLRFAFEKRKGFLTYKQSAIDAVDIYTEAALRDIHYGDALYKAIPEVEKLTYGKNKPILTVKSESLPDGTKVIKHYYDLKGGLIGSERAYAENFIKGQLGWPTEMERAVQGILKLSPRKQRQITHIPVAIFYKSLIGGALDTGVKNLTQGIHSMSELGIVPVLKGYAKLATTSGRVEAGSMHLLDEFAPLINVGENTVRNIPKIAKVIDDYVLSGPMRFGEFVNRGMTYHASMDYAIKKGMSVEAARDFALKTIRKTQYAYSGLDISPFARGAYTRPLLQFATFPLKTSELMFRWATGGKGERSKLFRYFALTGALTTGAKYAGVDLSNIFLDPIKMVDPDSKGGMKLPFSDKRVTLSFGKMRKSGFIPQGPAPVISVPSGLLKTALSDRSDKDQQLLKRAAQSFARYPYKVYNVAKELKGEPVTDARGRIIYKPNTTDALLKLGGLRSTDLEQQYSTRDRTRELETEYIQTRQKIIDLYITKKSNEAEALLTEFNNKYPSIGAYMKKNLTIDAIREEAKKKQMTGEERFYDTGLRKIILEELKKKP